MVSYQKFVSIYFDVMDPDSRESASDTMSDAASVWNENKEDLKTATVSDVENALQRL